VRSIAYAEEAKKLFSISDDGYFIIHDINEQKIVQEYNTQTYSNENLLINAGVEIRNDLLGSFNRS
jgi:hypothetical protein